jgi:hypothetical protein
MLKDPNRSIKPVNRSIKPVPFSIDEFARATGSDGPTVRQRIADGDLKTVLVGADQRIRFSELRRTMRKAVDQAQELRIGLALALRAGMIEEDGVDDRGAVVYRRTDKPWSL